MVKHQRRSHQRGLHPNELLDDCTSESDSGESPSTPTQPSMSWPLHGVVPSQAMASQGPVLHRAASFADYGHHMAGYNMHDQYQHRHSLGDVHEYHSQAPEQHHNIQAIQRTQSMSQQPYYVIEQSNPAIATMNASQVQQHYVPRQHVERPTVEIPYTATNLTSMHSSPGSFSPASGHSPSMPDGLYTHQAPQSATYALHNATPVEQQQPMVSYAQQMPQSASQPQPPMAVQAQQTSPHSEHEQWYQYQAPVEVATIGQLPPFGSGVYDLYGGAKIEFDDPSMQLPSSRIETM